MDEIKDYDLNPYDGFEIRWMDSVSYTGWEEIKEIFKSTNHKEKPLKTLGYYIKSSDENDQYFSFLQNIDENNNALGSNIMKILKVSIIDIRKV